MSTLILVNINFIFVSLKIMKLYNFFYKFYLLTITFDLIEITFL